MKLYRIPKGYALEISFENRGLAKSAGFEWDGNAKRWWTPSQSAALKFTDCANPELKAELLEARKKTEAALAASYAGDADFDPPCPEGCEYLPFQKAGVAYALNLFGDGNSGVLFADEPGLGKTIQSIGCLNCLDPEGRFQVLVVCPATLKINWKREIEKWSTAPSLFTGSLRGQEIGIAKGYNFFPNTSIVICNYDILHAHKEIISARKWDLVIADEIHLCKSHKKKRAEDPVTGKSKWVYKTRRVEALMTIEADYRIGCSGTPILNHPEEIWTTVHWLRPDIWKSKQTFFKQYCPLELGGRKETYGVANLDRLQAELRAYVMVRRMKKDVLKELPPKIRQIIELPADDNQDAIADEWTAKARIDEALMRLRVASQLAKASEKDEDYRAAVEALKEGVSQAFAVMALERKRVALAKVPYMIAHIQDTLETGEPVVFFAYHHEVVDKLREAFKDKHVCITGRTPLAERQRAVDTFQAGKAPLFIGNIQAAGVGITLTASSTVIFGELSWVPADLSQAEDRCHRIGQIDSVLVQHLVLEGSLDAVMAKRIVEKQKIIDAALNDEVGVEHLQDVEVAAVEDSDEPATAAVTRKQVVAEAVRLLPEDVAFIHATLQIVAGMDGDYAHGKNAMGFNKVDSEIGHSLAEARRLTPRMAVLALKFCHRYRGQLPAEIAEELEKIQGNCG